MPTPGRRQSRVSKPPYLGFDTGAIRPARALPDSLFTEAPRIPTFDYPAVRPSPPAAARGLQRAAEGFRRGSAELATCLSQVRRVQPASAAISQQTEISIIFSNFSGHALPDCGILVLKKLRILVIEPAPSGLEPRRWPLACREVCYNPVGSKRAADKRGRMWG
jgi:hypothetical protein